MTEAVIAVDKYGRLIIGPLRCVEALYTPTDDREYYGWGGAYVRKTTITEDFAEPAALMVLGVIGGLLFTLFSAILILASIYDRLTGAVGPKRLRTKLDHWLTGDPFSMKIS